MNTLLEHMFCARYFQNNNYLITLRELKLKWSNTEEIAELQITVSSLEETHFPDIPLKQWFFTKGDFAL